MKYIYVDLQKPNFTKFPEPVVTGEEKSHVEIPYQVEGPPKPSITWYKIYGKKEERLFTCNVNAECSKEHGVEDLHITKNDFFIYPLSFPNDNATFKCVASNSLGSTTKIFRLNVLGKSPIYHGQYVKKDIDYKI